MPDIEEVKKRTMPKKETIFTIVGDIFRLIAWFCYFNNIFQQNLYFYNLDFYIQYLFINKWKAIGIVFVVLFFVIFFQKKSFWQSIGLSIKYIISFFWRLLIFPLRLIVIFVCLLGQCCNLTSKLIKLHRRVEVFIITTFLYFFGLYKIIYPDTKFILQLSLFFIFLFLFCLLELLYLWSKDPYWWIYGINLPNIFDKLWGWWETKFITEDLVSARSDNKKALQVKKNIWLGFKFLDSCKKRFIPSFDRKRLLEQFLIVLFIVAIINIISFGFSFFAIYKLNQNSMVGIGQNIWEFIYFSTVIFFNSGIGSYAIVGFWARCTLILELFSFLFLLTIAILTFSTLSEQGAKQTIEFIQGKIEDKRKALARVLNENFRLEESTLIQYQETDFNKANETEPEARPAQIIDTVTVEKAKNEEIEKRILLLQSSDTWDEASRNVRYLLEFEEQFTQADILRIVDIVLGNNQMLSSYAARPFLKNFFAKNSLIIPKDKFEEFFKAIS